MIDLRAHLRTVLDAQEIDGLSSEEREQLVNSIGTVRPEWIARDLLLSIPYRWPVFDHCLTLFAEAQEWPSMWGAFRPVDPAQKRKPRLSPEERHGRAKGEILILTMVGGASTLAAVESIEALRMDAMILKANPCCSWCVDRPGFVPYPDALDVSNLAPYHPGCRCMTRFTKASWFDRLKKLNYVK